MGDSLKAQSQAGYGAKLTTIWMILHLNSKKFDKTND